jgi:hypothetical protein
MDAGGRAQQLLAVGEQYEQQESADADRRGDYDGDA